MAQVHGFCDERFEAFEVMLRSNLDSGNDLGAAVAVFVEGEPVVDLWGGWADRARTRPWSEDTIICVYSTSKLMVIVAVLMLLDRGELDLDAPVARYWPEFGANGKSAVTSRQVLTHTSGLPCFGEPVSAAQLDDWDHVIGLLERAALVYAPGERGCYSPLTFGFILGELVTRISGRPFAEFFATEIAEPLRADFHFGIDSERDRARVSELIFPRHPLPAAPGELGRRVMDEVEPPPDPLAPSTLAAVVPAGRGIGNARSLARVGAMLANGGVIDGRRHLAEATVTAARTESSYVKDELMGWCRLGLGFGLHSVEFAAPTEASFHWGGYGGSFITMDPVSRMSCAFVPNLMRMADQFDDFGVLYDEPRFTGWWKLIGDTARGLQRTS